MKFKMYSLTIIVVLLCLASDQLLAQNLTVAGNGSIGGDLGIGTQNPAAMLHFRAQANDTDKLLNFAENDNLSFFFEAGFAGTGEQGNTLKLNTFGSSFTQNAMTWRADGNVGIGALNPMARLQIVDGSNNTGSGGGYILLGSTTVGQANMGLDRSSIQARLDGGVTSMALQPAGGNVGIGLTDPDEKLEVEGNVKINGRIDVNNGATNIFIGESASPNASPQESVIIGYEAGSQLTSTGNVNTFIGKDAGRIATNAVQNVAVGTNAAEAMTTESFGVYVGVFAGEVAAADDAVLVGYDANPSSRVSNVTVLGSHAVVGADNRMVLGNVAKSEVMGYVNYSSVSDGRFKKNIRENVEGLDFIMDLRPVTYQLDARKLDDFLRAGMNKNPEVEMGNYYRALEEKSKVSYTGFIAQEVEEVATKTGFPFSGLVKPQNNRDHYGLRYAEFVVPLVKGMQEQQEQIETQEEEIQDLKRQLQAKETENRNLESRLARVEALLDKLLEESEENTGSAISITDARLQQNQPNPFNQTTTIQYFIPDGVTRAELRITDVSGRLIKSMIVDTRGAGQTTLDATTLSSGAYQYALFLDGRLLKTKQMVLSK